jgi:predicted DNA-binding protein (MmcQ/YjbR family)
MSDITQIQEYCLSLPHSRVSMPFGEDHLVFKVLDKMFALISVKERPYHLALKCDPDFAIELTTRLDWVSPAFHFNKKHWIQIPIEDASVSISIIQKLICHSYYCVCCKMKKQVKALHSEISTIVQPPFDL